MEITELFDSEPCGACLGTGASVNAGAVKRLVEGMVKRHGRPAVLDAAGVAESTMRSLLNGTREWQPKQLKGLVAMEGGSRE